MSADWKVGDKALCVDAFLGQFVTRGVIRSALSEMPVVGTIYLVTGVEFNERGQPCLHLAGMAELDQPCYGYMAHKFRKLVPVCDRVSISEEAKL